MEKDCVNDSYTENLKRKIVGFGADLVGVADAEPLKELKLDPPDLLDPFCRAISIALRLPGAVFERILDRPTPVYSAVYQTANRMLDEMAFRTGTMLEKNGFESLPIPASQVLDEKNWYGAIPHKAVGRMAGLGWQGKSLLLVNPRFGPRIRLVTVLTNALLEIDGPIKNRCGKCTLCQDACPVSAIKGVGTKGHYKSRKQALYLSRCAAKLVGEFSKLPSVGTPICGICIKVCPYGRKKSQRGQAGDKEKAALERGSN
jgi:epoxyqueuosine reductase QueG